MKQYLGWVKKKYPYVSPFLIALYTVLFLYSQNQPEYRLQVLIVPVVISLIFALAIFVISKFALKNWGKAAIVSSVFIFISLSYGRFLNEENDFSFPLGGITISSPVLVFFILLIAFSVFVYAMIRTKRNVLPLNKAFVVVSLILLLFPLYNIVSYEVKTKRMLRAEKKVEKLPYKPVSFNGERPDIYYIILDRYDGARSLKEQLNYDNSSFLDFLSKKGFYVPKNSTTNYPKTFLSFGASLNMEYMDLLTDQTNGGASSDQSIVTPLIRNNKIVEYLKNRGYKYVQVGSWWQPTTTNPNADISFYPPKKGYPYADEFTTGFLNTTIAAPIFQIMFHDPMDVSVDPQNNIHRSAAIYEFNAMKEVPRIPGPKFVFAHILLPHDPFVFDKDCNPITEKQVAEKTHQKNYVEQLKCANKKTEEMISTILSTSKTPPVIILQADEGTFPMNSPLPPKQGWGTASDQALREKFPILNSYYFPGKDTSMLYDTITPVNSFRVLFNTYFGENFPLLPDRNYVFQDEENYYKFKDVTDIVKN